MVDLWILLAGLFLIASVLAVLVSLFLFFRSPKKGYAASSRRRGVNAQQDLLLPCHPLKQKSFKQTRRLHGDKSAALRLYQYAQRSSPGKTDAW